MSLGKPSFGRSYNADMQLVIILVAFLATPALGVIVWRKLAIAAPRDPSARRNRWPAWASLATSLAAWAAAVGLLIYNAALGMSGRPVSGDEFVDLDVVLWVPIAVSAVAFIFGAMSPKYVRGYLLFSAACVACLCLAVLALPHGIL